MSGAEIIFEVSEDELDGGYSASPTSTVAPFILAEFGRNRVAVCA